MQNSPLLDSMLNPGVIALCMSVGFAYCVLVVVAALFQPKLLSGSAFQVRLRLPWASRPMGRFGSLLVGALMAFVIGRALYIKVIPEFLAWW